MIYCTAKPIKVILQVIFIHEFIGWIIQLNITFLTKLSLIVVVGVGPHYMIVPKLNTQHMADPWRDHSSGVLANKFNFFAKLNADGILVFYVEEAYLTWRIISM